MKNSDPISATRRTAAKNSSVSNTLTGNPLHYQATSPLDTSIVYADRFGMDPSRYIISSIDSEKLYERLQELYPKHKKEAVCVYVHNEKTGTFKLERLLYQAGEALLVHYHHHHQDGGIFFSSLSDPAEVEAVKSLLLQCPAEPQKTGKIHLLIKSDDFGGNLDLAAFDISKPETDLSQHYNDDLMPVHQVILERLKSEGKGIVLLHGIPGTGKTTYIRHLLHELDRKVIYIPQEMAGHIGEPAFLSFLMQHPGALLVIEDAENVLLERSSSGGGAIANLLNLSDGLLGDCLNIQVVCTFNTTLSRIDKALMRKGRIIARYEFGKLSSEKTGALAKSLGHEDLAFEEMTLADIFNLQSMEFEVGKAGMGF